MNIKKEIIKIMYEDWCTYLDDRDYFSFSKKLYNIYICCQVILICRCFPYPFAVNKPENSADIDQTE